MKLEDSLFTVVVPTRNRASKLRRTLDCLIAQQPAPERWRLVVVDNNCVDDTRRVLASYADRLPLFVVDCPADGMSAALNAAIPHIVGDLAILTNDDVLPVPGWLAAMRDAADRHSEFDLFGGGIVPEWEVEPPQWIEAFGVHTGVAYAETNVPEGPCDAGKAWGPNMAVRRRIFEKGFRFDERIGPGSEAAYAMGSDTEFVKRVERAGHKAYFVKDAVVGHIVRQEQLTERWLFDRAERHGRGIVKYSDISQNLPPKIPVFGVPAGLLLRLAMFSAAAFVARHLPANRMRYRIIYRSRWLRGAVTECRTRGRRAPRRRSLYDVSGRGDSRGPEPR